MAKSSPARSRPNRSPLLYLTLLWALSLAPSPSSAAPLELRPQNTLETTRAPCRDRNPLRNPYFGDLHVHTRYSLDAASQGTRNTPEDAYRFARGARVGIQPYNAEGEALRWLQLERPLDFAAVTDHSELLGEVAICADPSLKGHGSIACRLFRNTPLLGKGLFLGRATSARQRRLPMCGSGGENCIEASRTPWRDIQASAAAAYDQTDQCAFTTFIGYEWTGTPGTNNLHRNVIFRNNVVPDLPISNIDIATPEGLWALLGERCLEALPGCAVLAIPHNPNLSGGLMFQTSTRSGAPFDAAYAKTRMAFEPLVEVMQHKGDSECRLGPGVEDEACGFEKLPYDNFLQQQVHVLGQALPANSYVREALKEGLRLEQRLGVNPFRFGLIASTDTHLGTPGAVDESRHPGHGGAGPAPKNGIPTGLPDTIEFNPGGLAGVWAEENTRESLFDAMVRRETFGTSGPRILVRLFGGWDFSSSLCEDSSLVAIADAQGVPMGGILPPAPEGSRSPTFVLWAMQDPGTEKTPGHPLQQIQIVKGWLEGGVLREQVISVAGNPDNGASVDEATCETHGPGASSLCSVWQDPTFDAAQPAFYYARVLENPSCRWSTYVCNAARVDCADRSTITRALAPCCDGAYPRTLQERAWTSPIWYQTRSSMPSPGADR